jgi:hypothetical protein
MAILKAQLRALERGGASFCQMCRSGSKTPRPSRFGVLVTGDASEYCRTRFGDYGVLCSKLLRDERVEQPQQWDVFFCNHNQVNYRAVCLSLRMRGLIDQQFPATKDLDLYSAFVVSGSRHDAHSEEPDWIPRLRNLIARIYERQRSKVRDLLTTIALRN